MYRDTQGRPGPVESRCAHRDSTLFCGKPEADGIRCCYHGCNQDRELESQRGQRPITIHATEYLWHTYRGVQMIRQMLRSVEAGEPIGGLASGAS